MFITTGTDVVSSNPAHDEVYSDTTFCDKGCQWLVAGRWFHPGTLVSFSNKTDRHDIAEILLKVALNSIPPIYRNNLTLDFKQSASMQSFNYTCIFL